MSDGGTNQKADSRLFLAPFVPGLASLIPIGMTFLALFVFHWSGKLPEAGPARYT